MPLNVALEMPAVIARVYVEPVAALVEVDQRNDVRPAAFIDRADVRNLLRAKKLPGGIGPSGPPPVSGRELSIWEPPWLVFDLYHVIPVMGNGGTQDDA